VRVLQISTQSRQEFIDITALVRQIVLQAKIDNGVCLVFCPHTTAGLTINENADPLVRQDIIKHLEKLVPDNGGFSHSEGNSAAHIKASLLGSSVSVIIEEAKLRLGTWQGIYFCEFDGPRAREVYVNPIKSKA